VTIDDKNIELGSVASPSNTTADGGGITLKGATDKTLKWINSTGCWTFNQPMNFNDHVRIDSSGRVGIGGTVVTDSNLLNLQGSSASANIGVVFNDTNTSRIYGIQNGGSALKIFDYTASAERLRVNSSGRLLVGTTATSVHADRLIEIGNTSRSATFQAITTSTSGTGGIVFADTTTNDTGGYRGSIQYVHSSDSLLLNTAATERLRITSTGLIDVSGGIQVSENVTPTSGSGVEIFKVSAFSGQIQAYNRDSSAWLDLIQKGNNLQFFANGSERLRIDTSGQVGIGTTSIDRLLHVQGAGTSGTQVQIEGTSASAGLKFVPASGDNWEVQATTDSALIVYNRTDTAERLRIDSSGNVGIGVNSLSSSSRLTLLESAGNAQTLEIKGANSGGAGSQPGVRFSSFNGDNIGGIFGDTGSDALRIQTGGTDRVFVTNAGNVGIGDSSPGHKLVVKDAGASNTSNYLNVISGNAANAGIAFGDTDTDLVAGVLYNHTDNALRFFQNGFTEAARIDSSG
ncbi:hypothetical protein, partial [Limnobacter sp.]|uniref:hypothetical protein n=1 Tax=Limnobacter sp. TaxID=2003368 RepID=UPI0025C58E45